MSAAFPPPGFVQTESKVDGVIVYKPKEDDADGEREVVNFSCPNCLARTAYSARDGGLKCTNCGYYEPPEQEAVGKAAEQFEFKAEVYQQAAHGWGEVREEIECQNCYAVFSLPEGQLTSECPFCGSRKVIHHKASQDALRPRFLIPFTKTPEDIAPKVTDWLGKNWMVPATLRRKARLHEFTGIYLPFWTFDADTSGTWRAQVGVKKTRRYYSNGQWRTQSYVDWQWRNGRVHRDFDDFIVSGTKHVTQGILSGMSNYNMQELTAYDPKFLAGWQAQAYEIQLDEAWENGRELMREKVRNDARNDALSGDGDHVKNMSVSLNYRDESWRYVLLPVYLSAFNYQRETYQFVANGQTGSVAGSRPVDWFKVYLVVGLWMIPGAFLGVVALIMAIFLGPLALMIGTLSMMAFAGGFAFARRIVTKARKVARPDGLDGLYIGGIVPWRLDSNPTAPQNPQ